MRLRSLDPRPLCAEASATHLLQLGPACLAEASQRLAPRRTRAHQRHHSFGGLQHHFMRGDANVRGCGQHRVGLHLHAFAALAFLCLSFAALAFLNRSLAALAFLHLSLTAFALVGTFANCLRPRFVLCCLRQTLRLHLQLTHVLRQPHGVPARHWPLRDLTKPLSSLHVALLHHWTTWTGPLQVGQCRQRSGAHAKQALNRWRHAGCTRRVLLWR
mmetsp:Transcript_26480/g.85238  ORF Transcript_26480/g.85238 Transcript_26480/m.85238 type:complete len:216 (-) Transcript_26480:331-978(-)